MNKEQYEEWKERLKWQRWRWEFMRRSPQYIADYKKVQQLRGKAEYPPDYKIVKENTVTYPYIFTPEGKKEKEYCIKYHVASFHLPDPQKSFDELIGGKYEFDKQGGIRTKQPWKFLIYSKSFKPDAVRLYYSRGEENRVRIEINFDKINSTCALKAYVSSLIQKHSEMLSKKKQTNETDYDLILQVGTMKENGMTNQQIAKKLFPRDFRFDNESAKPESKIRTIGYYYTRYKELINGGYKDLTFP